MPPSPFPMRFMSGWTMTVYGQSIQAGRTTTEGAGLEGPAPEE